MTYAQWETSITTYHEYLEEQAKHNPRFPLDEHYRAAATNGMNLICQTARAPISMAACVMLDANTEGMIALDEADTVYIAWSKSKGVFFDIDWEVNAVSYQNMSRVKLFLQFFADHTTALTLLNVTEGYNYLRSFDGQVLENIYLTLQDHNAQNFVGNIVGERNQLAKPTGKIMFEFRDESFGKYNLSSSITTMENYDDGSVVFAEDNHEIHYWVMDNSLRKLDATNINPNERQLISFWLVDPFSKKEFVMSGELLPRYIEIVQNWTYKTQEDLDAFYQFKESKVEE